MSHDSPSVAVRSRPPAASTSARATGTERHPDYRKPLSPDRPFKRISGRLSLDFLNTVAWPAGTGSRDPIARYERFTRYDRVATFSLEASLYDEDRHRRLLEIAQSDPSQAQAVLDSAIRFRSALHWILIDTIAGGHARPDDLHTIDTELHVALSHLHLGDRDGEFALVWHDGDRLDSVLWPIVRDAADLLASESLRDVRECAGDPCGFLFLDTSPNHSRRWCVMQECGNRAKARRHYLRRRTGA